MAEKANITPIGNVEAFDTSDTRPDMVRVEHVSMVFNMASEQLNNLKEYAIALARRELMFKEFRALDDVSLSVKKGDVFGIMGTNGSGKSTLLKIIAGVMEPTEGKVEINGNIAPLIELGAGFDMDLTARENIYLNGALLGYSKKFIQQHFDEIVEFAEIEQFLDMPLKNYSSGMVARIAFAIATVIVPDILIVDEVLSVGDFMFQQKCERRIHSLIEDHGVTVMIVSHDSNQIERMCNRAIWIEKGIPRICGSAQEVSGLYRILGGHTGSPEAEKIVNSIMEAPIMTRPEDYLTVSADNRYSSAVKLLEATTPIDTVVIAPGDCPPICFLANSVAGTLEAPLLLTAGDKLPDATLEALQELNPARIVAVGVGGFIYQHTVQQIQQLLNCAIETIDGHTHEEVSLNAYLYGRETGRGWGRSAIITHTACPADHIAFSPFAYHDKSPIFFSKHRGEIGSATMNVLVSGAFENILIAGGGFTDFPEECLAPLKNADIPYTRFFGKNGYEASAIIADWIAQNSTWFTFNNLAIASDKSPEHALAVGPYASKRGSVILLEDPQALDSVADAFRFIHARCGRVEKLTFIGNDSCYREHDKVLLAKSLHDNSILEEIESADASIANQTEAKQKNRMP